MVPGCCWLKFLFLMVSIHLLKSVTSGWPSRTLPCDVTVIENTSDIVFTCDRQRLKEVPKEITENVTSLSLAGNFISSISVNNFSGLHCLKMLNLNELNSKRTVWIADGAFYNLTHLKKLSLKQNGLKSVLKKLPPGLEVLHMDGNHIASLTPDTFSGLKNLTEINLAENCYFYNPCNEVFTINGSFSDLTNLKYLDLAFNNLTVVPTGLPPSLETLVLASNGIQHIAEDSFKGLKNLNTLKLHGNCPRCNNAPYPCTPCPKTSLAIDKKAFKGLTNLRLLHLAGNSLRVLESSWFEDLTNLTELYLSFNFLTDAIANGGFLTEVTHLEKLDLSFNYELKAYPETIRISPHFSNLTSLRFLHIEGYVFRFIKEHTLNPLYNLKNLTVLNFGTNFIVKSENGAFKNLSNVRLLYLSENRLFPIVNSHSSFSTGANAESSFHVPALMEAPHTEEQQFDYRISKSLVKHECFASGRVLDLSRNNLFFISPNQFQGFGNISCLNLSRNGFAAALNGTEFSALPNLTYLDLSFNKIDLAYNNSFKELKKLQVLDLSYNPHYFTVSGVTHNFKFLENLPELRVLNLSNNMIFTLTTKSFNSSSLRELQFQNNQLKKLWKENDNTYIKIFRNLVNLTILDISHNQIKKIPRKAYENLPLGIVKLHLAHNSLSTFDWSKLKLFKQLEVLDLSNNLLSYVSGTISENTETLQVLLLGHNRITQLYDGFLKDAKSLHTLDLSGNWLTYINQTTFLPEKENYLETLLLVGNPFHCTCDILELVRWLKSSNIRMPYLVTGVNCAMPQQLRGKGVILFDIEQCVNDKEAFLKYSFTAMFIICTVVIAITMHLFYWDASYLIYYWRAKMKGYHYLQSSDIVYDAFVTYDTKDSLISDWVLNHLRYQLEECGDKFFPICLEERDWTPGVPMIENLSQSIRQSRKTVFVLTEDYVQSGTFKMALYLAHQRLMDENADVIVLLLLEPVLRHSQFLRLRRRLCGQSVLEWPRNPLAEDWFWYSLRNAIRVDNQDMYNKLYSSYFTTH